MQVLNRTSLGYTGKSTEALRAECDKMEETWGLSHLFKESIPDTNMADFIQGAVQHVI